jgi:predicted nucleic acid-binding protein
VLELLLSTPAGDAVRLRIASPDETLHAPHLLDLEVAQVLRRYCASKVLAPSRALEALEDLRALDLTRYPHDPMLNRIWQLRKNVTAYDAAYLALSEILDATLVTFDAKLAGVPAHTARVELLH